MKTKLFTLLLLICMASTICAQSRTYTVNGVNFKMIAVEGGKFMMGATSEQKASNSDEKPVHQVTLSSYAIGETEVTQALWTAVMGNNPSDNKGDNLPVECVSWDDCKKFISKLNFITGQNFRLPTEAEWEFAARGGNNSNRYQYSGSDNLDDVAWYWKNSGDKYLNGTDADWDWDEMKKNNCKTHIVATKQPNELGIYDMSGNIDEWCQDRWDRYTSNSQTNPTGPNNGSNRVFRGGSWFSDARCCRSSYRDNITPDERHTILGLRLAEDHYNETSIQSANKEVANKAMELQNVEEEENETRIFTYVEQMPEFPGGEAALQEYVMDHYKIPAVYLEDGIHATIMVRFVVNENGSIGDVQILKGYDHPCDKEARRVVSSLPRFTPGRNRGKNVKVWYQMPIRLNVD